VGPRSAAPWQRIEFGEFELDETRFELRRGGVPVPVQPRVFDLLRYLAIHHDHVVTKGELVANVWRGARIVDNAIARAVCEARRALGETADAQSTIATVRGRGYRFVAPLTEDAPALSSVVAVHHADEPPLVGRDAMLGDLERRIAHALGGAGGVVLLTGEPGIGKTRLVEEITTRVGRMGARAVVARCYEGEGAPAFWPWTQVARKLVPNAGAQAPVQAATELAALFPGAHVGTGAGPQARFELFDAVTRLLKRAAEDAPLFVAIDDMHLADDASMHLLVNAATSLRRSRTMILGTLRTTGRPSPQLGAMLGALARIDPSVTVLVEGLARDDVATFVRASTGEELATDQIGRLAQATGGNPLFLKQLARLRFKGSLPDGVVQAIVRHLEILGEPCRAALTRASVLDRSFTSAHLAHLCDVSHDELLDLLAEAARAGIVVREVDGFRFAHVLVRDALYSFLTAVERGALHARAARALVAQTAGRPDAPLSKIAHHFLQAAGSGCLDEAIDHATRAADDALARFGYETAIELLERALAALDAQPDPSRRRELLMRLGIARSRSADHAGSRAAFEEAAGLARALGMPVEMARAAFLSALAPETGLPDAARIELLEEALRAAGDEPSGPAAMCMGRLAEAMWSTDGVRPRRRLAKRAVDAARQAGDPEALAYTLGMLHHLCWFEPSEASVRERICGELEALAAGSSNDARVMAIQSRLNDAVLAGDQARAYAEIGRYERLAAELRQPYQTWSVGMRRTMLALAAGRLADAEASIASTTELAARAANEVRDVYGGVQSFMLHRERGRLGELEPVVRQLVTAFPALGTWPAGLAYIVLYYGDPEEARALLLERFGTAARAPKHLNYPITLDLFAEVAVRLHERRAAKAIYDALLPWAGLEIVIGESIAVDGCASRVLGGLAATLGRWDESEAHFARAVQIDGGFGARPSLAYAHAAWAEALAHRGRRGDLARAEEHAADAARIAHEIGMPKLLERIAPFGVTTRAAV
jgi:DNA-binding winged helix-turn-helix (wHTH) protein/tetratricopeptide (TPR) repeat protein